MLEAEHAAMIVKQRIGGSDLTSIGRGGRGPGIHRIDIDVAVRIGSEGAVHEVARQGQRIAIVYQVVETATGKSEIALIDGIVVLREAVIRRSRRAGLIEGITVDRAGRD